MTSRTLNFHAPLFVTALLLAGLGLINLYSATSGYLGVDAGGYFTSQILYHLLGVGVMFAVAQSPLRVLFKGAVVVYALALGLLTAVLLIGVTVNGSLSWINLGPVRVQPSEIAKLGLILMLSRHFSIIAHRHPLGLSGLVKPLVITLIPMALVIAQKDLGTSLFFGLLFGSLVFLQGIRWPLILAGLVLAGSLVFVSYNYLMLPYQQKRIVSFMHPELDPRGSGYHLVQSKIAVGSGQVWGRGYLRGESNKLKFLPERHTDFVFPVLAEEWGFAGASLTLAVYLVFLLYGINISARAKGRFGFFLGYGLTALFFWHVVVNIGGVLGLMPLTGVPLPMLSYGGSSLVTDWIAIGILLALYRGRLGAGFV